MSKVLAYYHVVFCTKGRQMTLPLDHCEHLYRFIWKTLTDNHCRLLRIGGIQNHVHMLIELHPSISLSSLMQSIKSHTSGWLKKENMFKEFTGWAREYYAATISANAINNVIDYIKNQHQHHLGRTFDDELKAICQETGLRYDERDMR